MTYTLGQAPDEAAEVHEVVESRPMATAVVGQVILLVVAAILLLMGGLVLSKAGLDGDLSTPGVSVFGFTHTAWLGVVELFLGILFLLSGLSPGTRDLGLGLGIVVLVAGILVIADPTAAPRQLGIEKSYGSFLLALGVAAVIGGILPNGRVRRWRRVGAAYATR